ncbi:MAG: T9SS type A sorting domain-containing protein [Pseudomonadota bacterium]
MKKYYLLILTLALSTGALFAQTFPGAGSGDYRSIIDGSSYHFWNDNANWEKHDGSTWSATTDIPGVTSSISYNVYIQLNTYLRTTVTIETAGKIWVRDNGAVTLNLGLGTGITGGITNNGDIDIQSGGNAKLKIWDNSHIWVNAGGTITDNSGGGITSTAATSIVLYSTSGTENASLITASVVTATVEQYISSGQWHFVSPALSGVTANDFWNGVNDVYIKPYLSPGGGWGGYITDIGTAINVGEGYEVWETTALTFSKSGSLNTGNQTLTLGTGGTGADADWNLVGNPYPCGLDWNLITDKTKAVGSAFYVYDGTSYLNHNGSTGTASSSIIPPFQGFFVQSNGGGNISFSNTEKAHPGVELYKSSKEETYTNHIKLVADLGGQKSTTIFYQQDAATNGKDIQFDAPMLFGSSDIMEVYTFSADQKTSINIYGEYPYVIEVAFKVPDGGGDITLTPTDLRYLDANLLVHLQDKETGDYINFLENPSYTFSAPTGDVTDRIYLIFNNNVGIDDIDKEKIQIYSHNNTVYLNFNNHQFNGEIKIYNVLGQAVYSAETSNNLYLPLYLNQPSGYYFVELITEEESITQKVFIQQ